MSVTLLFGQFAVFTGSLMRVDVSLVSCVFRVENHESLQFSLKFVPFSPELKDHCSNILQ